ncbi:hypothetical protein GCM10010174_08480 [Kutzneria viridogrisea]|uniref:Secreted protein n=2 Tax=Kutzneria TaxID=43356 RepID=W5WK15_9PSEU|nr:hypothetical protein [Kutzneria albida]AHI01549.1 hypothetical protein KALB_8191 [Kutzneria albida DSM 43870]MBA8931513.1 hypothetical protein [Kutzneria viridogrisea]
MSFKRVFATVCATLGLLLSASQVASAEPVADPITVTQSATTVAPGGAVTFTFTFTNTESSEVVFSYLGLHRNWASSTAWGWTSCSGDISGCTFTPNATTDLSLTFNVVIPPNGTKSANVTITTAAGAPANPLIAFDTYTYYETATAHPSQLRSQNPSVHVG